MDQERPPLCLLGCFDVRTWTLSVAIVNIVFSSLILLGSIGMVFSDDVSLWTAIICFFVSVGFIALNVNLRKAVFDRDIAPILLWLQVYVTLFVLNSIAMIVSLVWLIMVKDNIDLNTKRIMVNSFKYSLIDEVVQGISIYSVYQYYKFEKTCSQHSSQNFTPGYQTV